jgi:hypothetical protein
MDCTTSWHLAQNLEEIKRRKNKSKKEEEFSMATSLIKDLKR